MIKTEILKNKIKQKGLKFNYISDCIGISYYALNLKIEGKNEFKPSEIQILCKILDIKTSERDKIFFT